MNKLLIDLKTVISILSQQPQLIPPLPEVTHNALRKDIPNCRTNTKGLDF